MPQYSVFTRNYDEAVDLMVEAKNYMAYVDPAERRRVDPSTGLRISCEALRVTSRLTQVIAWLMVQRAVQAGEITVGDALDDQNRLSAEDVCLNAAHSHDHRLPGSLRSLLDRSLRLYLRISHLEGQIQERVRQGYLCVQSLKVPHRAGGCGIAPYATLPCCLRHWQYLGGSGIFPALASEVSGFE